MMILLILKVHKSGPQLLCIVFKLRQRLAALLIRFGRWYNFSSGIPGLGKSIADKCSVFHLFMFYYSFHFLSLLGKISTFPENGTKR